MVGQPTAGAAADWVSQQRGESPQVVAMVTLGDPMSESFADFVTRCRQRPLIRSIRIRLVPELFGQARGRDALGDRLLAENLELLARSGLVATLEATSRQLGTVTRLAADFPALKIVIDHFGWPEVGRRGGDLASHMHRLASLAELPNVATRIDAIGTIFGAWSVAQIRPWLMDVTTVFGPQRCMLGSDSGRSTRPTTRSSPASPTTTVPGCSTARLSTGIRDLRDREWAGYDKRTGAT